MRQRLTCEECGRERAASERGWQAYLATDEDEPAEVVVYCPDCARHVSSAPECRLRPSTSRRAPSARHEHRIDLGWCR